MPDTSRRPDTIFEERIDFEKIASDQARRAAFTVEELQEVLRRMETRTLAWVNENLVKKKLKQAINKYQLPLVPKYREIVRRRMTQAAKAGVKDVATEHDLPVRPLKTPDLSRVRARADALVSDHMSRLTTDLRRAWAVAMYGTISKEQLFYVTRQAYADFAGWEPPEGP